MLVRLLRRTFRFDSGDIPARPERSPPILASLDRRAGVWNLIYVLLLFARCNFNPGCCERYDPWNESIVPLQSTMG
ncbi:hypothetical protein N7468_009058 [Penicillium chermesinum]|uniref:Uncharacterized protein n=1 Tax=Penicillium chermesinum TaxID=63820 RepID=A0A9W9NH29_9EURO|nr:uncharacterized protein N7468_009058 [Penicillium chermesinum]KAJ5219854.1 hypothetical protein N7468_009058 [Penicillium chermesinum]